MKNLHLLPTDKPSTLSIDNGVLTLHRPQWRKGTQYMYITSDEEIKEGDWILNETHNIEKAISHYNYKSLSSDCKKIILTTDQELIKDGVQAIDDEFLEWFVKNPSCEEVKVEDYGNLYNFRYLILIPKEEPKQETLEEVAERYGIDIGNQNGTAQFDFIRGAKWQQEKMYSENDVELIANEMVNWAIDNVGNPNPQSGRKFDEVISKFKKK